MLKPDQHCGVITAMTTSKAKDTTQKIAATAKAATVAIVLYHPDVPEQDNRSFTIIGSGFCVHPEGIVITCRHVLADGFIDPDNRQPHVIFYHPEIPGIKGLYIHIVPVWESISDIRTSEEGEPFDLAVLKVAPPSEGYKGGYPVMPIAPYEDIHEMMDSVTCCFPLGNHLLHKTGTHTSSFSKAMVSSIIPWPNVPVGELRGFQLDLRVAHGNSGGPVFSLVSGQVFGVLKGGIERGGVQLLARAEPVYPIIAGGLVEKLLQGTLKSELTTKTILSGR
jgi:hypothetical protein